MHRVSGRWFRFGYGLVFVLLVANATVTYYNLRTIVESDRWIDHTREVVLDLERALSTLKDAETGQRGYLLTGEKPYLEPYERARVRMDAILSRLRQLMKDNPTQQAQLAHLVRLKNAKMEELRQTIALRDEGDLDAALQRVHTNYGKHVMDQARQLVLEMAQEEDRLLTERTEWSETASQRAHAAFSIATGLALGLLGVVYFLKKQEDREQDQADEALRRSEAWFHTTLRSLGEGVIATDERGQVRFLNPVAETLTGWTSEEARGIPLNAIYRVIHEQTREEVESPVSRVLREGQVVSLAQHLLLIARDGSEYLIEDTAAPIRDRDGEIQGAVMVVRDARERRQAESALRRSEERLRLIVESAQDYAIFTLDLDARITSWNSGARRIIGYEPDEILGAKGRILFIPEDVERGIPEIEMQRAASQGRSENERWHVRKDGTRFWSSGLMMPMREHGQLVGWLKILRDTTEQKRTEQELELSRERLNLVVSSSEVGLWYCDLPFDKLVWNRKCKEHFGLPPDADVTIDTFYERVHPDDRHATRTAIERAIQNRTEYDIEYRTVAPDGQQRWIRAIGRGFYDVHGEPIRFDGITVDVTQRIQQEQLLREADRRKNEFLATLAHELRNPLAPIRNVLHLLSRGKRADNAEVSSLKMAERQVTHLARLVDDLMDVARITQGKIELRLEPVELSAIVSRAVQSIHNAIQDRSQTLTVDGPSESIHLRGDATRLEQVFSNLLSNACKYTEPGGRIGVAISRNGRFAEVRIRDTGIGIPAEMLPLIFDMFIQVTQGSIHAQGGLGIGLGLVKSLVALHGGSIEAHSEGLGLGSEFVVTLPVEEESPLPLPVSEEPPKSSSGPSPKRRILVVDDNVDAAMSLSRLLARLHRQEVQVAHDGPSALAQVETFHPEVILLDIGMPGMNGYEVARRLREQPSGSDLLLVALTGWGQHTDRLRSQEAGFDHHLVKPVDPDELISLIDSLPD